MTSPISLGALRAFVEVGRHGSIKQAASRLGVTPGAVSQQIKALELRLGVLLLERGYREVRLSPPGQRLFEQTASGFDQIESGLERFEGRRPKPQTLVISTTPSFAACWLTSRLGHFVAEHKGFEVRLETSVAIADLNNDSVDVAIRHGADHGRGLDAVLLFTPQLVIVASPSLLPNGPLRHPSDCFQYPLLQDRDRADWSIWFEAHGIKPPDAATRGASYADDALLIQAALAGQGLAVVRDAYASDELANGNLELAIETKVQTSLGYFAVARSDRLQTAKIAAFRRWIVQQAKLAPG